MSERGTLIVNPGLVSAVRKLYDELRPSANYNGPSVMQEMEREQDMWNEFYRIVFAQREEL